MAYETVAVDHKRDVRHLLLPSIPDSPYIIASIITFENEYIFDI